MGAEVEFAHHPAETRLVDNFPPPPSPLPSGWILRDSKSQPGYSYYYHAETGVSSWQAPHHEVEKEDGDEGVQQQQQQQQEEEAALLAAVIKGAEEASRKRNQLASVRPTSPLVAMISGENVVDDDAAAAHHHHHESHAKRSRSREAPTQVHAYHILKKHKDSKRPSSWRSNNQPITISREDAIEEMEGLIEILLEEKDNVESLTATFMELAKEESDCNSAKRMGDLGWFGRKKMRPEFEQASFALEPGEMSGIVETSSGVHVILRVA